tara:strand:- start:351 stop:1121 length:771 start_codon:yes stop_codon:yes gene_type:complete
MIALLSPAKKLDESPLDEFSLHLSQARFLDESEILMKYLRKMKPKAIGKLMDLSANLSELNFERNQKWDKEHTLSNSKPAILTFNGDAYLGLNAKDFSENDLSYAQDHLRMLSGLYGILRPLDLIQAYRLEMGRKLNTKKHDNLYGYWGGKINEILQKDIDRSGSPYLINVASNEYARAANFKQLKAKIITCEFKEHKNGEYKAIMVFVKKARGLMSRFIIKNQINDPEELKAFDSDNYVFNPKMSADLNFVFTRN